MKILGIAVRFCLAFAILVLALVFLPTSEAGQRPLSGDLYTRGVYVSNDEAYAIFAVRNPDYDHLDIYSVRLEGGAPRRIAHNVFNFDISPDSRYVYYTQLLTPDTPTASLSFVPISGGTPTLVDSTEEGFNFFNLSAGNWVFTPDGRFLLYTKLRNPEEFPAYQEMIRLAVGADSPVVISDPSIPSYYIETVRVSSDSTTLAYTAVAGESDDSVRLMILPLSGGPAHVLNTPPERPRDNFVFTPDNQRLVFSVGISPASTGERLYSSRVDGSDLVLLREGGRYSHASISGDSAFVFYSADEANGGYIYEQPITGGAAVPRFGGPELNFIESNPMIDPSGHYLLFFGNTTARYLYSMPLAPGGTAVAISDAVPPNLVGWDIIAGGQRVLYRSYFGNDYATLHTTPIDGSTPPTLLYANANASFLVNHAGTAVYFASVEYDQPNSVLRLPVTGEEPTEIYRGNASDPNIPVQLLSNDQLLLLDHRQNFYDYQLWIADDNVSAVAFTLPEMFTEETESIYTATVALDAASLQTVTVDIVLGDGTATEGSDFTFTPVTLTFAPGEREKLVPVTILADEDEDEDEDDGETIVLEARNIEGGTAGAALSTTITLRETVYRMWLPRITQ